MTEPKWWDFTASKDKGWTREKVIEILEPVAERFCVGDEIGEGGFKHLQGRVVFKTGKELKTCKNLGGGNDWHWSPTSALGRNFEYTQKDGEFYCSWEGPVAKYANIELKYWQRAVMETLAIQDDRQVLCILDPEGGAGKTTLARWAVATHKATYCPQMQEAMDYMAFAMAKPSKAYIFDLPRAESIKQRKGLWSAIEQIKNGYLYDKRYSYRDKWIDPPKVLVFANEEPPRDALSDDRWDVRYIRHLGEFVTLDTWTWSR